MTVKTISKLIATIGFKTDTSGLTKLKNTLGNTSKTIGKFSLSIATIAASILKLNMGFSKVSFNANLLDTVMFNTKNMAQGLSDAMNALGGNSNTLFSAQYNSRIERANFQMRGIYNSTKGIIAAQAGIKYQAFLTGKINYAEYEKSTYQRIQYLKSHGRKNDAIQAAAAFRQVNIAGATEALYHEKYGVNAEEMGHYFTRIRSGILGVGSYSKFSQYRDMNKEQRTNDKGKLLYSQLFGPLSKSENAKIQTYQTSMSGAAVQTNILLADIKGLIRRSLNFAIKNPYLTASSLVAAFMAYRSAKGALKGLGTKFEVAGSKFIKRGLGKTGSIIKKVAPKIIKSGGIGVKVASKALPKTVGVGSKFLGRLIGASILSNPVIDVLSLLLGATPTADKGNINYNLKRINPEYFKKPIHTMMPAHVASQVSETSTMLTSPASPTVNITTHINGDVNKSTLETHHQLVKDTVTDIFNGAGRSGSHGQFGMN